MLDKASRHVKSFFFPLAIILVAGFLAVVNYEPGTILTGWDSLHPEFNFPLALKRAFFGVWREDQGLGALSTHSHMADLPRIALLWATSFFLRVVEIRYFYTFLTLILGPLGTYFFIYDSIKNRLASFLGSITYLLNLTVAQHYFVPFEMFLTQYALLPWLFLLVKRAVDIGRKRDYLFLFLVSLFAAPMAYAATLFYAYLGALVIFLFFYILMARNKLEKVKRGLLILLLVFATNAFWFLPNIYSVRQSAGVVTDAKINTLFSPEAFLRNKDYGSLEDIVLQKSYLFSWRAYDFSVEKFTNLMDVWSDHLGKRFISLIGYMVSGIALTGTIFGFLKKNKVTISLFGVSFFSLFFLFNANPPLGGVYAYLYDTFPVFREGFRMPFSKFSIIFLFTFAFYLSFFFKTLFGVLKGKVFKVATSLAVLFLLFSFVRPAFSGHLISGVVKTRIPEEYNLAFDYLDENGGRVAKLPIYTPFNWEHHNWRYEGSAWFSWFYSGNPQLDRDFDRFSKENETFYREASFALYEKDPTSFEKVLEKYNISHLLFDESIINAGGSNDLLFVGESKKMLSDSDNIKLVQKYGFLSIYKTDFAKSEPVFAPEIYNEIDVDLTYARKDPIYEDRETYQVEVEGITYPFVNYDKRKAPELSVGKKVIEFRSQPLSFPSVKYLAKGELDDPLFGEPEVSIDEGKRLTATIPVNEVIRENLSLNRGFESAKNCDVTKIGDVYKENNGQRIVYSAKDGGVSCDYFVYDDLSYKNGYILNIKGENIEGRSLKIYLQNRTTKRMDLEELLPKGGFDEYFFVLPKDIEGEGYTLNLETRSFGDIASENIIEEIEFIPFPYIWLSDVKLVPQNYGLIQNDLSISNINKRNTARYDVELESGEDGALIVLDQAYEEGWRAYLVEEKYDNIIPFFSARQLKHAKVNTWANGWFVPEGQSTILIIYLPQYLEYLGFLLLFCSFLPLLLKGKRGLDFRYK